MKKKIIFRIVLGVVVLLVAGFVTLAFSLGAVVKKGVETIGPRATQTDVKLKSAQVWLMAGHAELQGFVLGNPRGYKTAAAITVDDVSVAIKPSTVFSEKIVMDKITVKAPVITLEGGLKNNNLTQIEKNLNEYMKGPAPATPTAPAPAAASAGQQKKLQVNDLEITGAKVELNTMLSAGKTIVLPIPDIHLTNLGTGPDGITPLELAQTALHAELDTVFKAVEQKAGELGSAALQQGKGAGQSAVNAIKGLIH